jgi:RHS repeat-associated protein
VTRGIDPPEVEGYQWDGWKLIMIAKLNTDGTYHSRKWSCVWRPDIGSSLYARSDWMRAGGVGGVAWLQTGAVQSYSYGTGSAEVHVPLADHMGNVRHYYQFKASGKTVTGQLVASYEYDAFGREVRAWGTNTPATNQPPGLPANRPWADLLPFHYSSKLRDADSGFNYYGYRFYDPGSGRWLNRDPIGEEGGVNLYGMVGNDPINYCDLLGLTPETDLFAAIARGSAADIETVLSVYAEVLQPSAVAQGQAALARIAANEARKIACAEVLRRAFKKKRSGLSGKAASSDKPSWVKEGPRVGEKGEDFATRLLDEKYGQGGWTRGGRTEFSQIQKWADRAFE